MSGKQELWRQYVVATLVNVGILNCGIMMTYASPASPHLLNGEPFQISEDQNSWFTSTLNIGALVGALIAHILLDRWGRRGTMLISTAPLLFGWVILVAAQNVAMLIVGRLVHGLTLGLLVATIPPYVGEISHPSIRGKLGGFLGIFISVGYMYSVGFGWIFKNFRVLTAMGIIPAVFFMILTYFFVPESPAYLIDKNREEDTKFVLRKLNGASCDISPVLEDIQLMAENSKTGDMKHIDLKSFRKREVYVPLLIVLIVQLFQQFSGINAFLFNLFIIFQSVGVNVSSDLCSVLVSIVLLVSFLVSSALIDRYGRKIMLAISYSGAVVGLFFLGLFFYLKDLEQWKDWTNATLWWLPILSILGYIFSFGIGAGTVGWILVGEFFPSNVRMVCSSVVSVTTWAYSFIVSLTYAQARDTLGSAGIYWLYAGFCFLAILFTICVLPETKGKSLLEIVSYFKNRKFPKSQTLESES